MMDRTELIKKYLTFFESKNHKINSGSSLVPENDPTVLFTTAGMQPLVPFLLGQTHPLGKRIANVQRCIRTGDIDEVGDTYHHTLFEMLGNWSLGDYFKKEAVEMSFEFLTKELNLPLDRLAVSVFAGDKDAEKDNEAANSWKKLGISEDRIAFLGKKDNWWGPAGATGPCGTDTEIFYWKLNNTPAPKVFDPENKNWVEIWNNVLMGFVKNKDGNYEEAKQKNIDTGMGVERTVAILNGLEDNYEADMWKPIIEEVERISNKSYIDNKKEMRIIADHIKAAVFIIADGIVPSNAEQGYVLRRLIRRAMRDLRKIGVNLLTNDYTVEIAKVVVAIYGDYEHIQKNKKIIYSELKKEEDKFQKTLDKGLREFQKMIDKDNQITKEEAFLLYQSYGFPIEMIKELAEEKNVPIEEAGFHEELIKHQELSRTASAGKFKSGLADNSEETSKLHTAAHMLLSALKKVLGNDVNQKGSNINTERLRFDFNFDRKLTDEEKKKIEDLVNLEIAKNQKVIREEMSLKEAKKKGATGMFDSKYGDIVSVYTIGEFSKEICTGPHAENTSDLGKFKIKKEQSSSSGIRRIKAILE